MSATDMRRWHKFTFIIVIFVLLALFVWLNPPHFLTMQKKVIAPPISKGPAITLWFDDAWISQYTEAFPLMDAYDFRGDIAVPTNFIESKKVLLMLGNRVTGDAFMTWSQLRKLQDYGWEISSHTMSHSCDIDFYTPETIKKEFSGSKQVLLERGFNVKDFVMPCGTHRKDQPIYSEMSKLYYRSYRSLEPAINSIPVPDFYNIKGFYLTNKTQLSEIKALIDEVKKEKGWLILTFHFIDESHQKYAVTPQFFKEILDLVKQSNVPVVTPGQILIKGDDIQTRMKKDD